MFEECRRRRSSHNDPSAETGLERLSRNRLPLNGLDLITLLGLGAQKVKHRLRPFYGCWKAYMRSASHQSMLPLLAFGVGSTATQSIRNADI